MLSFLKRNKQRTAWIAPLFDRIGATVDRWRRGLADYLNKKTAKWSTKKMKLMLLVFCFVYVGSVAWVIWYAFHDPAVSFHTDRISVPQHINNDTIQNKK